MALDAGPQDELSTSNYGGCLNGVINDIIAATLPGIGNKVYFGKRGWHKSFEVDLPAAVVSLAAETSQDAEGPVNQSIVHYRVLITMVWAGNRDYLSNIGEQLRNRQLVSRLFRKARPSTWVLDDGVLRRTTVIAGEPHIRDAALLNLDAQFLIVDCSVCEPLS